MHCTSLPGQELRLDPSLVRGRPDGHRAPPGGLTHGSKSMILNPFPPATFSVQRNQNQLRGSRV